MKWVENSNNLQKIASLALEWAIKKKNELRAQLEKLIAEVANLKQQLSWGGEATINNYVAHFYKIAEYDSLDFYWRKVTYNKVFKRIAETASRSGFDGCKGGVPPSRAIHSCR